MSKSQPVDVQGTRPPEVLVERSQDGVLRLRHPEPLDWDGRVITAHLRDNAQAVPARVFLEERHGEGWRSLTYGDFHARMMACAAGLREMGVRAGDVAMIAAENGADHAVFMFAMLQLGAVVAPVAPQFLEHQPARLRELCAQIDARLIATDRPGAIAEDLAGQKVSWNPGPPGWTSLSEIEERGRRAGSLGVFEHPAPDRIAKIMFTSGSTGAPKAVVNTHGMLASAQAIQSQLFRDVTTSDGDEIYTLTDWLPWHHTYGGNSNLNGVIVSQGRIVLDRGQPTAERFADTLATLKRRPPTLFAGVPASFNALADALEQDDDFAAHFFAHVRVLSNGGAALSPATIDRIQAVARRHRGAPIPIGGGYGMTETCAVITQIYWQNADPATLGLPPPGVELKLLPLDEDRYECRVRGANVTPGYYERGAVRTDGLFDEEGYFRTGDALRFVDPDESSSGLAFAGRLTEEFKLQSGVWVRVNELRLTLIEALSPMLRDAVIVGENQSEVGALLWLKDGVSAADLRPGLERFNAARTGSSRRIPRTAVLRNAPSAEDGELTAKGTLNQIRMRTTRRAEIDALFTPGAEGGSQ